MSPANLVQIDEWRDYTFIGTPPVLLYFIYMTNVPFIRAYLWGGYMRIKNERMVVFFKIYGWIANLIQILRHWKASEEDWLFLRPQK